MSRRPAGWPAGTVVTGRSAEPAVELEPVGRMAVAAADTKAVRPRIDWLSSGSYSVSGRL